MTERFTIEIELRGIDDASDELKTVSEKLKSLGVSVDDVGKAGGKAQERIQLLNEALKDNKINAIQSGEAVDEILKKARASNQTFKALAESTKVFSDRAEFIAKQLNTIAGFGAKLNGIYNSINNMMIRLETTQVAYNQALENQRELVRELRAELGLSGVTLEELRQQILEELEMLADAEDPTPSMIKQRKELTKALEMLEKSEREVAKASQAVSEAKSQMAQQMFALSLQAVGLIPAFMQVVNTMSTLAAMLPRVGNALGAVKAGFTALYSALGPIGLALLALTVVLPLIAAHWEQIEAALKPVADAIWSVVGPALEWLWKNILKPFVEFLIKSLISNIETARKFFIAAGDAVLWLAKGFEWFWNTILVPFAAFIANIFINYINVWIAAFIWAYDQITSIFNAIKNIFEITIGWIWNQVLMPFAAFIANTFINYINVWIAGLAWAHDQITSIFNAIKDIFESTIGWIQDLLVQFGTFIANVFINYIRTWIAGFIWARDQITSIFNAIKDIIERTIGWILDIIKSVNEAIRANFMRLSYELVGGSIIPEMWKDIRAWTAWGVNEVNKLMSEVGFGFNPTIRGPISINVAVNITSPAASAEEIAEVVSREIARRLRAI